MPSIKDYQAVLLIASTMGGLCAFIIITGRKTGALEWLQARSPRSVPWGCNFCLGFWFSVIFTSLLFFNDPVTLTPFLIISLSTAINHAFTK